MSLALTANSCCATLAQIPGLNVYTPGTKGYNATEASFWSLTETHLTPQCIVAPTCTQEVSDIVASLVRHECKFAIKSQGHAPGAGFANIENGVTIDITGLNKVSLDSSHSVASVGMGASWLDVYQYLDPFNKTVAGGRNGAVGVGGLTLGGGISYFSPQVGFTCDSVVNFEAVLASGEIVNANSSSHPDLFRALKGGVNNFGVVTRSDYSAVDYTSILAGSVNYDLSQLPHVFSAFAGIAAAPQYDVHASIVVGLLFNGTAKSWSLSSTPIYTLPDARPKVYSELFAIPNTKSTLSITKLGTFANEPALPPLNWLFQTITFGPSDPLLDKIFDKVNSTLMAFNPPGTTLWSLAFEPLPQILVERGSGKNSMGTTPADGNSVVLLISAFWTDDAAAAPMQGKAVELTQAIKKLAEDAGQGRSFLYANYAGPSQKVFDSYGKANVDFLKQTSARYDPRGVFQTLVPGGFKLSS